MWQGQHCGRIKKPGPNGSDSTVAMSAEEEQASSTPSLSDLAGSAHTREAWAQLKPEPDDFAHACVGHIF